MKSWAYSALLGALLTVVFLYPLIVRVGTHLPSREDGVFIAWTINFVGKTLREGQSPFQAPLFHPFRNTLAYSDPFLTSGAVNFLFTPFTGNLVLQHNLHLLIGTLLTFVGMWLLAEYLLKSRWAAAYSALIFTFSSMHLHYLVHLHTYLIAGLPFTIYFLLKWSQTTKSIYLSVATVTFILQAINAPMTGFFVMAVVGCLLLARTDIRQHIWLNRLQTAAHAIVAISALALVYWPYFQVSQEFHYTRSIRDAAHFAHSLNRFIVPELVILYSLSVGLARKKFKQLPNFLLACVVVGGVLMLGPALKVNDQTFKIFNVPIPLPYAVLFYLVPGFQAFRATSRWITVFNFGMSLVVGWSVTQFQPTQKKWHTLWLAICLFILTAFFFIQNQQNLKLYPVPLELPNIYDTVKSRPEMVIAEFPVFSWRMHPYNYLENDRLLSQNYHGKILYNGVSGFTPPIREDQWDWLWAEFPSKATLDHLKTEGVELILVHYDVYQKMFSQDYHYQDIPVNPPDQLKTSLEEQSLQLLGCEQSKCLYRF